MATWGRKDALIDSIVELTERKGVDISGNTLLLNGLRKMNEKEVEALEEVISDLVNHALDIER